jgi:hypothetical protein
MWGIISVQPASKERDYADVQFFLKQGIVEACLVTKVVTKGEQISCTMEREGGMSSINFTWKNKVKKVGHASIVQSWWQAAALFSMMSLFM